MYRYFEYPKKWTEAELTSFYNSPGLEQHGRSQRLKAKLKISRIARNASFKTTDVLLDYGCGSGAVLCHLSNAISCGIGVDISREAIAQAPQYENLEYAIVEPGRALPFPDEYFDKVLLLDVLEHVLEPSVVLRDCIRVTKLTGELVIEVPFTGVLSELAAGQFHQGHLRYFDPTYLSQWLGGFNLDVNWITTSNSVPLSGLWLRMPWLHRCFDLLANCWPSRYYPWFGEILVSCSAKRR